MSQAPNKASSVAETAAPPHADATDGPDAAPAPLRPWRAWPVDTREAAATLRARRWAVVLMAGSSVVTIAVLATAWLLLRHLF